MAKVPGRAVSFLLMAAVLAGCATNPYIEDVRPKRAHPSPADGSMASALRYADDLRLAYYNKHVEEFQRERQLSGGLLTLAAAGLLAATGHAHRDVLVGMAVAGGLAYQLGTWNTSRSRLDIYLEGREAVRCAKAAIAPLNLGPGELQGVRQNAARTREIMDLASRAAGQLRRWRDSTTLPGTTEAHQRATLELDEFTRVYQQASEVMAVAAGLEAKVNQAANQLELQLNRIEDSVTGALNGTLADLRNLPLVIGDILASATMFQPGLDIEALRNRGIAHANRATVESLNGGGRTERPQVVALPPAYEDLHRYRLMLIERVAELSGSMVVVQPEDLKAGLAKCGVDTSRITGKLRLGAASITLRAGGLESVGIFGGTPPYTAEPLGELANGLTIRRVPPASLSLSATTTAVVGSYQVTVRDAANAETALTVLVQSAEPPPSPPPAGGATTESLRLASQCPGFNATSRELTCFIQHATGSPVDGIFGSNTCTALRARRNGDGRVNDQAIAALAAANGLAARPTQEQLRAHLRSKNLLAACRIQDTTAATAPAAARNEARPGCVELVAGTQCRVAGARCEFECDKSRDQVMGIGRALGLNPPPETFDNLLRTTLASFQKQRGLPNTSGDYTLPTAQALQAQPR